MPILACGPGGYRRVFPTLREYYNGTVRGEPLSPAEVGSDGQSVPIPEQCPRCGLLARYINVAVA